MVRNLIGLFVVVVLSISGLAWYHAQSVRSINAQPLFLFHWEDTTAQATIRQVIHVPDFKPVRLHRQSFGYTESLHWFRFRLSAGDTPRELTLDVRNQTINRLDVIAVQNGRLLSVTRTGDWLPFSQRPILTKSFAFPVYLDAHQTIDYYVRVDKRFENLATEITLWRTSDFEDKEQRAYFLWGIFVGVVVLVVLLNFIYWGTTSDRVYLWYALYVLGLTLRQAADTGLGFQYLWPALPALNAPDPVIQALWLYIPAMLQFQQYFLNLQEENKPLFRVTQIMKYVFWAGSLIIIVLQILAIPQQYPEIVITITRIHAVLANIMTVLFVWTAVVALRSDNELRQLYGAGAALQTACQLINIIQNTMRYLANSTYFIDPYLILTVIFFIDLVVFAYLLAYRYRQSLSEQQQLTINLAQSRQETNQQIIEVLDAEREQIHTLLQVNVCRRLQEAGQTLENGMSSPKLAESRRLIQQVDTDLNQILQNSLPVVVAEKGLTNSLFELIQHLNQTQPVPFTLTRTGDVPFLSIGQEVQLYRIGTELITNVIKHANATQANVVVSADSERVSLTVSDNGKGFDTATVAEATGGIGVRNLYARARELRAEVTIKSGRNGTTIAVLIPQKIQTS
ncbi:sensor histidine kinase [Spirosoma fluminis]